MENNIEITQWGIKCDNPECEFVDNTVKFEQYPQYINKGCPHCGDNLLTKADYENAVALRSVANLINKFSPDELDKLTEGMNFTELKDNPLFQDVDLSDFDENDGGVAIMEFSTHGEIKIKSIKSADKK